MGRGKLQKRPCADIMSTSSAVTGSCNWVVVKLPNDSTIRFIVDCGLFLEKECENYNENFPFDPRKVDFALLTHIHNDHCGRLPLLVRKGFEGTIYASNETCIFAPLALNDSLKVLKDTAKRKHTKELYAERDVQNTIGQCSAIEYNTTICVNEHIKVTGFKNGHLVGAMMFLVQICYPGCDNINLLFTGDYNSKNLFFEVPDLPQWVLELPVTVIQESTYGNMESSEMIPVFGTNIAQSTRNGETVIIPVFSLGRSQEILYFLKRMQENNELEREVPIFFDGKLAQNYSSLYKKKELGLKAEMLDFLPENLIMVNKENRERIIKEPSQKIVITTSGMGTHGPAPMYIQEYVSRDNALIHFTGYTAEGTLGRILQETPTGKMVLVNSLARRKQARVVSTKEFSAHAKVDEMCDFLKKFKKLQMVLVTHGEPKTKESFADRILAEVRPKSVGILNREYLHRIDEFGFRKTMSTKFE